MDLSAFIAAGFPLIAHADTAALVPPAARPGPAYAIPPLATTLRRIQPAATALGAAADADARGIAAAAASGGEPLAVQSLAAAGFPDGHALFDRAALAAIASGGLRSVLDGSATPPTDAASDAAVDEVAAAADPLIVVVDAGCGAAVLRGADAFAPGVLCSTRRFEAGDTATLVAAFAPHTAAHEALPAAERKAIAGRFSRGAFVTAEEVALHCVAIARGPVPVVMGRTAVFSRKAGAVGGTGVALRTSGRGPLRHPPLDLAPAAAAADEAAASARATAPLQRLFAQNLSSFVPPALLAPREFERVADLCAAPGGKASHLMSIAREAAAREAAAGAGAACKKRPRPADADDRSTGLAPRRWLTVCERSARRAAALESLLERHHSAGYTASAVEVHCGDALHLLQPRPATGTTAGPTTPAAAPAAPRFDAILLDPPCTGLGLRPRLQPHRHTATAVRCSAAYQRRLLGAAIEALAPGGRLVYSTCTITAPENEGTVRWALSRYGQVQGLRLRLRRPRGADEVRMARQLVPAVADVVDVPLQEDDIEADGAAGPTPAATVDHGAVLTPAGPLPDAAAHWAPPPGATMLADPALAPIMWRFRPTAAVSDAAEAIAAGGERRAQAPIGGSGWPEVALDGNGFFVAAFELAP